MKVVPKAKYNKLKKKYKKLLRQAEGDRRMAEVKSAMGALESLLKKRRPGQSSDTPVALEDLDLAQELERALQKGLYRSLKSSDRLRVRYYKKDSDYEQVPDDLVAIMSVDKLDVGATHITFVGNPDTGGAFVMQVTFCKHREHITEFENSAEENNYQPFAMDDVEESVTRH